MPIIYLSPSTQQANRYINVGTEEQWMNYLADNLTPYLTASGIRYERNTPNMTAGSSITASNNGNYDLHLALHSNASGEGSKGQNRGIICLYSPNSSKGKAACYLIANSLKVIYPLPNDVKLESTTSIGEVSRVRAPSAFLEIGFHDNIDDALWIQNNIPAIAYVIALSVSEYLGMPFLTPIPARKGFVTTQNTDLNIRDRPSSSSTILAKAPKGSEITIVNEYEDWYVVMYNNILGWASSKFITLV